MLYIAKGMKVLLRKWVWWIIEGKKHLNSFIQTVIRGNVNTTGTVHQPYKNNQNVSVYVKSDIQISDILRGKIPLKRFHDKSIVSVYTYDNRSLGYG